MHTVGACLKVVRKQRHMTQEQVAARLGMSRQNYTRIEKDQMGILVQHLMHLAEIWDVPVRMLLPKQQRPEGVRP